MRFFSRCFSQRRCLSRHLSYNTIPFPFCQHFFRIFLTFFEAPFTEPLYSVKPPLLPPDLGLPVFFAFVLTGNRCPISDMFARLPVLYIDEDRQDHTVPCFCLSVYIVRQTQPSFLYIRRRRFSTKSAWFVETFPDTQRPRQKPGRRVIRRRSLGV